MKIFLGETFMRKGALENVPLFWKGSLFNKEGGPFLQNNSISVNL